MQFDRDPDNEANAIVACADDEIRLRGRAYTRHVIVTRDAVIDAWQPPPVDRLGIGDFAELIALKPDVILLGTGTRQRMPPPQLIADLAARGIGLEAMDNRAACRTFNVLLSEYRDVAVALMIGR
ncbi:MAG: Mth938-like domain-containing protein [Steroidobacteraceae bacterium]